MGTGFLEVDDAVTQASHLSSFSVHPPLLHTSSPSFYFFAATWKIYYHNDLLYNKQSNNSFAIR